MNVKPYHAGCACQTVNYLFVSGTGGFLLEFHLVDQPIKAVDFGIKGFPQNGPDESATTQFAVFVGAFLVSITRHVQRKLF